MRAKRSDTAQFGKTAQCVTGEFGYDNRVGQISEAGQGPGEGTADRKDAQADAADQADPRPGIRTKESGLNTRGRVWTTALPISQEPTNTDSRRLTSGG